MIDYSNYYGEMTITCDRDGCFDQNTVSGSYDEGISEVKELGWRIFPDGGGGYIHVCPSCDEKESSPTEVFK